MGSVTQANVIAVYKELVADLETPVSVYARFAGETYSFLLESAEGGERWSRYSFIGFEPEIVFRSRGRHVTIERVEGHGRSLRPERSRGTRDDKTCDDPFLELRRLVQNIRVAPVAEGLPRFWGGAVGYLAYDMVRFFEKIPDRRRPHPGTPDALFLLTGPLIIFDNLRHRMIIVVNLYLDRFKTERAAREYGERKIEEIERRLRRPQTDLSVVRLLRRPSTGSGLLAMTNPMSLRALRPFDSAQGRLGSGQAPRSNLPAVGVAGSLELRSNMTREEFCRKVERVRKYIVAGDVTQAVISLRLEGPAALDPLSIYRAIRDMNPSPYLYCLKLGDLAVVGSSPEVMVRLEGREAVMRPIAGTRPRGKTPDEDAALARELIQDPKEKAEHLMLVDLGRNDIGRIAEPGTVAVDEFMTVERYSHVMHLVSNVKGRLADGLDGFDLIRATFPAGTLTGSPKVRAMEIIEELEPARRGIYGGALGYIGFSGDLDLAITIRTAVLHKGRLSIQAGAGIVFDSDPGREYQECLNKAAAMVEAAKRV